MNTAEIYLEACRRGLRLEPAGDKLAVLPKGKCPPEFAATLREHKTELLAWLSRAPCPGWQAVPPDDLPLNPIPPRPTPANRGRVISFLLRQGGARPGQLTAWLVKRENAYYEGFGRHWDCALHVYAAARDAACWQLNRTERDAWELLTSLEEAKNEHAK